MSCERYFELLSARLDRELTREEAEDVKLHLDGCPACRIVWEQMEELQETFAGLEDVPAPEGFSDGVMDRVRALEREKKISLFKRPQVRALAGLAACAVLAAGLYGVSLRQSGEMSDGYAVESIQDTGPVERCMPEADDTPMITAYAAPEDPGGAPESGTQKSDSVQDRARRDAGAAAPAANAEVLTLDRMPEGVGEWIPPVPAQGLAVTEELFETIGQLAQEQGIPASVTAGGEEPEAFYIVVLSGSE